MRIKKIAYTAGLVLMVIALLFLLMHFPALAANWQQTLNQARTGLRVWRLMLYAGLAVTWFTLSPRLQQQSPAQYRPLSKTALWSLALLTVCEISNILQQGGGL